MDSGIAFLFIEPIDHVGSPSRYDGLAIRGVLAAFLHRDSGMDTQLDGLMVTPDKIYGTKQHWRLLYEFLLANKEEYIDKYMFETPQKEGPIASFSKEAGKWIQDNCRLYFVQQAFKRLYGGI